MATDAEPPVMTEIEVEELNQMRADLETLSRELEKANLRTDVALDVVPLIDKVVEDHRGRSLVVADIVACWQKLSPEVVKKYEALSHPMVSALGHFAYDYVTEAADGWLRMQAPEIMLLDMDEEMDRLQWNIHIAQVQQRNILGQPPGDDWLGRFPLPIGKD